MVPLCKKSSLGLASAFLLLAVAGAFSQSLPTVKDWTGMTAAERLEWNNLKAAWNPDSMSPETRSAAEQLNQDALAALAAGDHAASAKHLNHALAVLRRQDWTPARARNAALTAELDRTVVGPGEPVKIHLGQSFALDEGLKGPVKIVVSLQEATTAGSRPPPPPPRER